MPPISPDQYQLPPVTFLCLTTPSSELAGYFEEILRLAAFEPKILASIGQDLTHNGLEKKKSRLEDACWNSPDQAVLPGLSEDPEVQKEQKLVLASGRPRMSALACYFFWMLSTRGGGVKTEKTREYLLESKSVELFLQKQGIKVPGLSTIQDNVNAIRPETRKLIFDTQIAMALQEGLDDFEKIQFDSTPVDANTAWPTDSGLIWKLCRRLMKRILNLKLLGVPSDKIPEMDEAVKELKSLDFRINCCPANQSEKRKELYRELLDEAEDASHLFTLKLKELRPQIIAVDLKPSKRERLMKWVHAIEQDLADLYRTILHCIERVLEDKSRSAEEKLLSIADPDANYLKKGNREARIGYKPQLARSEKGLVTALIVPEGNAGDAPLLQSLCKQSFERAGVVAKETSGDGGYASKANRKWLLETGVKKPSFSSSKGKAITPTEDWESLDFLNLRKWRSAVEALMSQLKDKVDFGAVVKRGWKRVKLELTDKVLAFNFMRLSMLRS